ncbi:hypothetical protein G6F50_018169 [Rhizopus delemar]|uniref:Uncharacterized protein n=1 Tax=Rhizopus delemar TaxID=936053 RepID=A0A9P6XN00_9FUNG|nr:hypothetical protein G6F50_018169 [Rhizopus delemar]
MCASRSTMPAPPRRWSACAWTRRWKPCWPEVRHEPRPAPQLLRSRCARTHCRAGRHRIVPRVPGPCATDDEPAPGATRPASRIRRWHRRRRSHASRQARAAGRAAG